MSEMVDRVAEAIDIAGFKWLKEQDPKDERLDFGWADVPSEVFARAAIIAMQVPTKSMCKLGRNGGWHGGIDGDHEAEEESAELLYMAMVREALK